MVTLDFYYVIDVYSKYVWIVPMKDKKNITLVNAFQKIIDDSKRKPNKLWVDQYNIQDMVLDLIHAEVSHYLVVMGLVKN